MTYSLFDLTGRCAVVTGGNGGIGLGMARGLAKAGARIVVAAPVIVAYNAPYDLAILARTCPRFAAARRDAMVYDPLVVVRDAFKLATTPLANFKRA